MSEEMNKIPSRVFHGQWTDFPRPSWAQENTLPSCTIPDQSMTIQEIIQKYTRTGLIPSSYLKTDEGGNVAEEPGFDPLDEYDDILAAAAADMQQDAHGSAEASSEASGEPVDAGGAGDGGKSE